MRFVHSYCTASLCIQLRIFKVIVTIIFITVQTSCALADSINSLQQYNNYSVKNTSPFTSLDITFTDDLLSAGVLCTYSNIITQLVSYENIFMNGCWRITSQEHGVEPG